MPRPQALVVGASIAGPVCAFWLRRAGFDVTVVERAPELRRGGNGVDVREQAIEVAHRMGIMGAVAEHSTKMEGLRFLNRRGALVGTIDLAAVQRDGGGAVEILRTDLARLLHAQTCDDAEYVFGDAPVRIEQDRAGVDVEFESGASRRFDVVVGADGAHSGVRRLVFGGEQDFLVYKQHFVAAATVATTLGPACWSTLHTEPGRGISSVRPVSGPPRAYFIYRDEAGRPYEDHRHLDGQRRLLRDGFAGIAGAPARILDEALSDPDLYFDALMQVQMPSWSKGRVVLAGDAASCASPLSGSGALLAMVAAYRLAGEIAAADGHLPSALAAYEARTRPLVASKQKSLFTGILAPKSRAALLLRNGFVRSPIATLALKLQPAPVAPLDPYAFEPVTSVRT